MYAVRLLFLALILLLGGSAVATALDPRDVDILGLRLGMSRSDLLSRLAAQGIARSLVQQTQVTCDGSPAATCVDRLTAPTRDGELVVRFDIRAGTGRDTVWSIAYTLAGRGAGEPAMIRAAVMDRFGPPVSRNPALWCRAVASACRQPDQPQLIFQEGPGTRSTLTLVDPVVRQPER